MWCFYDTNKDQNVKALSKIVGPWKDLDNTEKLLYQEALQVVYCIQGKGDQQGDGISVTCTSQRHRHSVEGIESMVGECPNQASNDRVLNHSLPGDEVATEQDISHSNVQDLHGSICNDGALFVTLPSLCQPKSPWRQTYGMWKASCDLGFRLRTFRKKPCLYLVPLDNFPSFVINFHFRKCQSFFQFLREFSEIYFLGFTVCLLDGISTDSWNVRKRVHKDTKQEQLLVSDLQKNLKNSVLPSDGAFVLGNNFKVYYISSLRK